MAPAYLARALLLPTAPPPEWLTVIEAAEWLGIDRSTLDAAIGAEDAARWRGFR
jgi:hypothetical protein